MVNKNDELWIANGEDTRKLRAEKAPTVKIPNDVKKALKALSNKKKSKKK